MSIIEKAIDRLAKDGKSPEPAVVSSTQVPGDEEAVTPVGDQSPLSGEIVADNDGYEHPSEHHRVDISIRQLKLDGIISPEGDRSRTAEEFRMIKRPLLDKALEQHSTQSRHNNLIMVTSAIAGEGKTFTSLNLAISMAMEMDRTVLLVDADVARPGLSRLLQMEDRPGLLDRLDIASTTLGDVMLRTDVHKLRLIPAGSLHIRSTELLASNSMRRLLDEIALRYQDRIVIFDSPPLLETTEASVLASQMGQIVLIVEAGATRHYLVKEAIGQLETTDNLSLVLNKSNSSAFFSRYGYGYGYGQQGD